MGMYLFSEQSILSLLVVHYSSVCVIMFVKVFLFYILYNHVHSWIESFLLIIHSKRALGTLAQLLGNTSTAEIMLNRSQNYQNVWSNSNQLMCQRDSSGRFDCPLDPNLNTWLYTNDGFTEGVCMYICSTYHTHKELHYATQIISHCD